MLHMSIRKVSIELDLLCVACYGAAEVQHIGIELCSFACLSPDLLSVLLV